MRSMGILRERRRGHRQTVACSWLHSNPGATRDARAVASPSIQNPDFGSRATPGGALPLTRPSPSCPGPLQLAGDRVAQASHGPAHRADLLTHRLGQPVEYALGPAVRLRLLGGYGVPPLPAVRELVEL